LIQKRNIVLLKNSKEKIGLCPLSPKKDIRNKLCDYYKVYKPTVYLFEGRNNGLQYDARSLQLIKTSITKKQESQSLSLCIGCGG
jgi:integrase/recombinase XerD